MPEFFGDVWSKRSDEYDELLEDSLAAALLLGELIDGDHECRDGSVVGELLDVARHLLDELVERLEVVGRWSSVSWVLIEVPELLEEAEGSIDTCGVPRLRLLDRAEEHLIKTQRVGAVTLADVVGIDHIVFRLRHLLNGGSSDELAVSIADYLHILELGSPLVELFDIHFQTIDEVHVHMYGIAFTIFSSDVSADILLGALQTQGKTAAALNHTLVDELLERFLTLHYAPVLEELVPETAVDEVTCSVL